MAQTLTLKVSISGIRETLAKFRDLPKDATVELRDATLNISEEFATKAKENAITAGGQAVILAPTIKAKRDRVPAVQAGGSSKIGRNRKPAYKLLFGSEFGSVGTYPQFPARNTNGYWFYPTVAEMSAKMSEQWIQAAETIIAKFSEGG